MEEVGWNSSLNERLGKSFQRRVHFNLNPDEQEETIMLGSRSDPGSGICGKVLTWE